MKSSKHIEFLKIIKNYKIIQQFKKEFIYLCVSLIGNDR